MEVIMQEATIVIGKRVYKNKHAAMKALKDLDRRIQRKIEKQKAKQLIEYEFDEWEEGPRNEGLGVWEYH